MPRDTIRASEKALADVFCDKYLFQIPAYQRPLCLDHRAGGRTSTTS
jgi:hypothetical protein